MKRHWVQFQASGPKIFTGDKSGKGRPTDQSLGPICELTPEMKEKLKGVPVQDWVLIDNQVVPRPEAYEEPQQVEAITKEVSSEMMRVAYIAGAIAAAALLLYGLGVF